MCTCNLKSIFGRKRRFKKMHLHFRDAIIASPKTCPVYVSLLKDWHFA